MKLLKKPLCVILSVAVLLLSIPLNNNQVFASTSNNDEVTDVQIDSNTIVKCKISNDKVETSTYVDGILKDQTVVDLKTQEVALRKDPSSKLVIKSKLSDYVTTKQTSRKIQTDNNFLELSKNTVGTMATSSYNPPAGYPSYLYDTDIMILASTFHPYLWANYSTIYGNSTLVRYNQGDYISVVIGTIVGTLIAFAPFTAGLSAFAGAFFGSLGGAVISGVITKTVMGTANTYKNVRNVIVQLNGSTTLGGGINFYKADVYETGLSTTGQVLLTNYLGIEGDTRTAYQMCYDSIHMLWDAGLIR